MRENVKGGASGAALILAIDRGSVLELRRRLGDRSHIASETNSNGRKSRRIVFNDTAERRHGAHGGGDGRARNGRGEAQQTQIASGEIERSWQRLLNKRNAPALRGVVQHCAVDECFHLVRRTLATVRGCGEPGVGEDESGTEIGAGRRRAVRHQERRGEWKLAHLCELAVDHAFCVLCCGCR
jgi:hypothetical protein